VVDVAPVGAALLHSGSDDSASPAVASPADGSAERGFGPIAVPSLDAPAPRADPAPVATGGGERPQRARRRRNRRIIKWSLASVLVVVLLAGAGVAVQRATRPLARPVLTHALQTSNVVPGAQPALPWPSIGQAAIAIPSLGYAQQSGPESPVPVASLTKMTTAVVILRDHPMAPGASGPSIAVTADDVGQYDYDLQNDESNIPIQVGEQLTELQMIEALLNQSANDIAYSLAVWDSGSEAAFVAKMNSLAASLGATGTHYVDASGFDPQSVSTAADTLRIAAAGMAIPAFAAVAALPTVTLPLVGTAHNIVTEIGSNGIVGVKSGYTSQASGCMVLAGYRTIDGRSVLVLASALGQHVQAPGAPAGPAAPQAASETATTAGAPSTSPSASGPSPGLEAEYPLLYTGPVVEALLHASEAAVVPVTLVTRDRVVVTASTGSGGSPHRVPVVASRAAWLLGWPGQHVVGATEPLRASGGRTSGKLVGSALWALGKQVEAVPLQLTRQPPSPSLWWRIVHG
jgi:D-alanyl-D-alanine carboxypeptidase (penicillin-binding protein 5/6)